ncbi:MAG TPA: hemerythrin family protein [Clostridia bacterium]|jgi:hemerythrin|nr:hemerythrin family protein [Clostridia bacterium]
MSFKWKDEYSMGIAKIDQQHKRLFEIGSQIYELARLKDDVDHFDEIVAIIGELKDYTKYHFQFEEELMDLYQYPQVKLHKLEHFSFIKKLNDLDLDRIDEDQERVIMDLLDFVISWVTNHIIKSDFLYKDFLKGKI